ncbi:MAG: ComF family protein [Porticoccaceae bacterium]|nr:ComF family protein [Porticoccaceae bacterium]
MPNGIGDSLLKHLFPGRCLCCDLPSQRSLDLCVSCERCFRPLHQQCLLCAEPMIISGICGHCQQQPPAFSRVVAPFIYGHPLAQLITGLKHGRNLSAGRVLAHLLAEHLETRLSARPDCIVPMPLHRRRLLTRGFNQAREIARGVAAKTAIPLVDGMARRVVHTPMQQNLNRHHRASNLRNGFSASPRVAGLHIAVVDDVVTTTSTARAISATLAKAGAEKVEIWCVARTALEN